MLFVIWLGWNFYVKMQCDHFIMIYSFSFGESLESVNLVHDHVCREVMNKKVLRFRKMREILLSGKIATASSHITAKVNLRV